MINVADVPVVVHDKNMTLPKSMDWFKIATPAIDQGSCGMCWAVATVQTVQDRRKIRGLSAPALSPESIAGCADTCITYGNRRGCVNMDCDGGFVVAAMQHMVEKGAATGNYDAMACPAPGVPTVKIHGHYMVHLFSEMYGITAGRENQESYSPEQLAENEHNIKAEIFTNGPVVATFNMMDDFVDFVDHAPNDAVYRIGWKTNVEINSPVGNTEWSNENPGPGGIRFSMSHTVSIVGYGVTEQGERYWLVRNSWGLNRKPFLRFRRGVNESAIESTVEAADVGHTNNDDTHLHAQRSRGLTAGPIVGIVIGSVVLFVMVIFAIMYHFQA